MMLRYKFAVIFLLTAPAVLQADLMNLKNGQKIYGRIKGQSADSVTFATSKGTIVFQKKEIRMISYGITQEEVQTTRNKINKLNEAKKTKEDLLKKQEIEKANQVTDLIKELEVIIVEDRKEQKEELERRKTLCENINQDIEAIQKDRDKLKKEISDLKKEEAKLAHRQIALINERKRALGEPEITLTDIVEDVFDTEEEKKAYYSLLRRNSFYRSAVFPGWGQFYMKKKLKASFYITGTLAGLAGMYSIKNSHNRARQDYKDLETQAFLIPVNPTGLPFLALNYSSGLSARKRIQTASDQFQAVTVYMAGLYFINLMDVFYRVIEKEESGAVYRDANRFQLTVSAVPLDDKKVNKSVQFSYRMRF